MNIPVKTPLALTLQRVLFDFLGWVHSPTILLAWKRPTLHNKTSRAVVLGGLLLSFIFVNMAHAEPPKFEPKTGDRVVFLGSTLVERDATFGYFETFLTLKFKAADFTFRNLGWSGDSALGEARAGFGTQKDGYNLLLKQVNECKPTILLINYGMNESFEGEAGLGKFVANYNALLNDLDKTGAKIWLISPNRHEKLPLPLPDPAKHNEQLALYTKAIGEIASKRGYGFVNCFETGTHVVHKLGMSLTTNGIHFNESGALFFGQQVLWQLTGASAPSAQKELSDLGTPQTFERLVKLVNKKNQEYFYRWRPQNETYIFGFRKHEQGKNAVEIPQFDPIIEKLEAEINLAKQEK